VTINKNIYKARSRIARALANETRLEIIDILGEKKTQCVCELTEILDVAQSTVSKHLGILKNAGIVDSRKEGLNVRYFLRVPCVSNFFSCIDRVIEEDFKKKKEELQLINN